MWCVRVFTTFNTIEAFNVPSKDSARKYAKRAIREGLWYFDPDLKDGAEIYLPAHQISKVTVCWEHNGVEHPIQPVNGE